MSDRTDPKDSPAAKRFNFRTETDVRFPSGEWKGFWIQRAFKGRQWMRLAMQFGEGIIQGEGRDIVGLFVLSGRYQLEDGKCSIVKQYVGRHRVYYNGGNDGDGLWLWGTWKVALDVGGFHIWPKGEKDPTGSELSEARDIPVSARLDEVFVGVGLDASETP